MLASADPWTSISMVALNGGVSQIFKDPTHRKKHGDWVIPSLSCPMLLVELIIISIFSCVVKHLRELQV